MTRAVWRWDRIARRANYLMKLVEDEAFSKAVGFDAEQATKLRADLRQIKEAANTMVTA
jgi:hypothetical protein